MNRAAVKRHLLITGGALLIAGLLGVHLGVNYGTWWLLVAVAVVLHLGAFVALIAWVARRVRRHRTEASEARRPQANA